MARTRQTLRGLKKRPESPAPSVDDTPDTGNSAGSAGSPTFVPPTQAVIEYSGPMSVCTSQPSQIHGDSGAPEDASQAVAENTEQGILSPAYDSRIIISSQLKSPCPSTPEGLPELDLTQPSTPPAPTETSAATATPTPAACSERNSTRGSSSSPSPPPQNQKAPAWRGVQSKASPALKAARTAPTAKSTGSGTTFKSSNSIAKVLEPSTNRLASSRLAASKSPKVREVREIAPEKSSDGRSAGTKSAAAVVTSSTLAESFPKATEDRAIGQSARSMYEATISSLKAEIEQLQRALATANATAVAAQQKATTTPSVDTSDTVAMQQEISHLRTEVKAHHDKNSVLNHHLESAYFKLAALAKAYAHQQKALESAQQAQLSAEIAVERYQTVTAAELAQIRSEHASSLTTVSALTAQIASESERHVQSVLSVEDKYSTLERQMERLKINEKELLRRNTAAQKELKASEVLVAAQNVQIERLRHVTNLIRNVASECDIAS